MCDYFIIIIMIIIVIIINKKVDYFTQNLHLCRLCPRCEPDAEIAPN